MLVLLALAFHAAHTLLGLPMLEGIEQVLLAPGPNLAYLRPGGWT